jgi:hypothetical protein
MYRPAALLAFGHHRALKEESRTEILEMTKWKYKDWLLTVALFAANQFAKIPAGWFYRIGAALAGACPHWAISFKVPVEGLS